MAIKKIKLPGMEQPVDIGTTWTNVSNKPDLITSEEATAYMQKGVDYVTAGKKAGTTLGQYATAEGINTTASGISSHAEGGTTTASGAGSHAEGGSTVASGQSSHAEGKQATASGPYSHAEGYISYATGEGAHSEGYNGTANGKYSHREGYSTGVTGNYGHVEGQNTYSRGRSQHVFGEYNIEDASSNADTRALYVEIVGNGNSTTRSNARTLDWGGNEILAGKLTVGAAPTENMDVATKQYVDNILATKADKPFKCSQSAPSSLALADNTEYTITGVTSLSFSYPSEDFECWIKLTTASSGTISISFPTSSYTGILPTFSPGQTWEISIKNKIVAACVVS